MADTVNNPVFFKDLSLDLIPNPTSGDIRPITNELAIRRSLLNLLRTEKGERLFDSEIGTALRKYLFAPANALTETEINNEVYETITKFEPRVVITSIKSTYEDEGIEIQVNYYIRNTSITDSVDLLVSRA